jgi:hypothetical protein
VYVRTPRKLISASVFAGAIVAAGGIALLRVPAVQAEDAIVVNGQDAPNLDDYGGGMPRSSPRVQALLAAHPDQFVVLCIAGCNGPRAKILQLLPRPVDARTAEFRPSAAGPGGKDKGKGVAANENDDVLCIAGCPGKRGQVLQRDLDLPPPVAPKPPEEQASEEPPPVEPAPPKAPEPLDIHP